MADVAVLAEQLAVVGGDGHVRAGRQQVEEVLDDAVEVAHRFDLTGS